VWTSSGFAPILADLAGRPQASHVPPPRDTGKIRETATVERVLIGSRAGEPEARVAVADGSPGGAEIRLVAIGGGRRIVAEILTASTGSRDTLSNAMEEIRVRLRRRGIALSILDARQSDRGRR
jgi:hypothetical protein